MDMNAEALEVKKEWQEKTDLLDDDWYQSVWEYAVRKFSSPAYNHVEEDFRDRYLAILFDEEIGHTLYRSYLNAVSAIRMQEKEAGRNVFNLFADTVPSTMPECART